MARKGAQREHHRAFSPGQRGWVCTTLWHQSLAQGCWGGLAAYPPQEAYSLHTANSVRACWGPVLLGREAGGSVMALPQGAYSQCEHPAHSLPGHPWDADSCKVSLALSTPACTAPGVTQMLAFYVPASRNPLGLVLPFQAHAGATARELGLPSSPGIAFGMTQVHYSLFGHRESRRKVTESQERPSF